MFFYAVKLQQMKLLRTGIGLSVAAWITPADTKLKNKIMSDFKAFTDYLVFCQVIIEIIIGNRLKVGSLCTI